MVLRERNGESSLKSRSRLQTPHRQEDGEEEVTPTKRRRNEATASSSSKVWLAFSIYFISQMEKEKGDSFPSLAQFEDELATISASAIERYFWQGKQPSKNAKRRAKKKKDRRGESSCVLFLLMSVPDWKRLQRKTRQKKRNASRSRSRSPRLKRFVIIFRHLLLFCYLGPRIVTNIRRMSRNVFSRIWRSSFLAFNTTSITISTFLWVFAYRIV